MRSLIIFLFSISAFAQAPPQLSATEAAAIEHLRTMSQMVQTEYQGVDADFRRSHPGWYISPATLQAERIEPKGIAPATATPTSPAVKPPAPPELKPPPKQEQKAKDK